MSRIGSRRSIRRRRGICAAAGAGDGVGHRKSAAVGARHRQEQEDLQPPEEQQQCPIHPHPRRTRTKTTPRWLRGARRRSPPLAQAVPVVLLPFRLSLLIEHRCRSLELRLHPSARISFPSALKSGAFDWIRDWLRSPLLICGAAAPSSEAVAPRGLSRGPGRMRSSLRPKSHERKTRRDLRPWGCSRG